MSKGADPEAAAWRVFELESNIPEHLKHAMGERFRNELDLNAGYAGHGYAAYLVQIRHLLPQLVDQALEAVRAKTGLDNRYRFWLRLFAVTSVAGVIVQNLNLLDISLDRIHEWLWDIVRDRTKEMKEQAERRVTVDPQSEPVPPWVLSEFAA